MRVQPTILLLLISLLQQIGKAQTPVTYTIKPGDYFLNVIPAEEIFRYPKFSPGTVFFKDGRTVGSLLNYSSLAGTIQFINARDTLSLAEEQTIRQVVIQKDTFLYSNGFYRVLSRKDPLQLLERVYFKEFTQNQGAYGMSTATTSTENINAVMNLSKQFNIQASHEINLVKYTQYGLMDKRGNLIYPDRKKLLKANPGARKQIEEFFLLHGPENNLKKDDFLQLMDLLQGLEK